jgi:hypothetical protein
VNSDGREGDLSDLITLALLFGVGVVGYTWGWWAALLAVGVLLVLWVATSSGVEKLRWRRRGVLEALRDVDKWHYRSDVNAMLAVLGANEKAVVVVPATRRDPSQSGVLMLTDSRLLFRPIRMKETTTLAFRRERVAAVSVRDDPPWAYLQLAVGDEQLVLRLASAGKRAWTLAGHFLAEMDAGVDADTALAPSLEPVPAQAPESSLPRAPTQLTVSPEAVRELVKRGGSLYLWQEDFTANLVLDKLDTRQPSTDCEFEALAGDGFEILIDSRIPPAETIAVKLRRFPRRRFEVLFDGRRWGHRGVTVD